MALTLAQQIAALQAAGIPVTTTKPTSGYWVEWAPGIYTINPSNNPTDPRHGLTQQQYDLAAAIVNPYLSTDALNQQLHQAGLPPVTTTTAIGGTTGQPHGSHITPPPTTTPPVTTTGGFTPFTPTSVAAQGSGVTDPYQPTGLGFGSDYGLSDLTGSDPNFAFGSGSTAPPAPTTTAPTTTSLGVANFGAAANYWNPKTNQYSSGPAPGFIPNPGKANFGAAAAYYNPATGQYSSGPAPGFIPNPASTAGTTTTGGTPSAGSGTSSGGGSGAGSGASGAQQDALASLQQTLATYGLGNMTDWAWGEIIAGKSQQQVLLDLMQTPQFKQRFPAIDARAKAGLPPISPGDYVSYENQATQLFREAGLPSGFWDSPADFTHLISSDVSINELNQRVNLASQAAYQVPADVRATLQRDYGVGAGQLAAFFLDDKTALPLIQRDFTAAQIGGAAYRTGYGSTKTQDETLTDLGVTPGQAQQGFTQLTLQRQLFSSLPGENTTGISRDDQLAATFGGNALDQEKIVRRAKERTAVFAAGGGYGQSSSGFTIGQAQGA